MRFCVRVLIFSTTSLLDSNEKTCLPRVYRKETTMFITLRSTKNDYTSSFKRTVAHKPFITYFVSMYMFLSSLMPSSALAKVAIRTDSRLSSTIYSTNNLRFIKSIIVEVWLIPSSAIYSQIFGIDCTFFSANDRSPSSNGLLPIEENSQ